jgi:hypothetical protein
LNLSRQPLPPTKLRIDYLPAAVTKGGELLAALLAGEVDQRLDALGEEAVGRFVDGVALVVAGADIGVFEGGEALRSR